MVIKLFKNREVKRFVLACAAIGLAACIAAYFINPICCAVCALLSFALIAASLIFTARRYKKMAELSNELDRLLSGEEGVDLKRFSEGEFSILENKLSKLVLCLREQADALKKDKLLLADAIADISHQIKTPLTSINLLASALSKEEMCENALNRGKTLAEMHSQIDRMDWLVSSLLKLARLDADAVKLNMKCVPLAELIELAVSPLEIVMELRNQQLTIEASGSVLCDASWTAEALMNIIKNCSESMVDGVLSIYACENPLYSEIIVTDGGGGIAKEDLPHIFERFYRGKNSSRSGAGIGLALARSIVIKQNGTVKAENAPRGGARFTLRFYKGTV